MKREKVTVEIITCYEGDVETSETDQILQIAEQLEVVTDYIRDGYTGGTGCPGEWTTRREPLTNERPMDRSDALFAELRQQTRDLKQRFEKLLGGKLSKKKREMYEFMVSELDRGITVVSNFQAYFDTLTVQLAKIKAKQ